MGGGTGGTIGTNGTTGTGGWHEAAIVRVEARTPRLCSVFLRAPLARHLAGQHVEVRLTAPDGYQARRSYSIASAPGAAEIELAIALQDDGEVSAWFHAVAQPGDTLDARGPLGGYFLWDGTAAGPVLLVAGGAGVVPLVSIARAWHAAPAGPMLLLHSARTSDALAFGPELAALAGVGVIADAGADAGAAAGVDTGGDTDPRFTYIPVVTREGSGRRIDAALLEQVLAGWRHLPALCYVCGPSGFVEAVAQLLVARGVPYRAVRTERFG